MAALASTPTIGRLLVVNGVAMLAVFTFLALSPAPVAFPDGAWEGALLFKGGVILLIANVLVSRLGSRAHSRGTAVETASDPLLRMRRFEQYEVIDHSGVIGVVDEVMGDATGVPAGLIVVDGWFGARRFLVPFSDVDAIDDAERTISV
jgi:PRC-barrel domain protein